MSKSTSERWVTISALIVIGVYGYRRVIEPAQKGNVKNLLGAGNPVPLGQFITAWGVTFLIISIMAEASPGFGGAFAILVAVADFLGNAPAVFGDVQKQEGAGVASKVGTSVTNAGNAAGSAITGVGSRVPGPNPTPVQQGVADVTGPVSGGSGIFPGF